MKKTLNKIKIVLSSLWVTIISFPFKAMGQELYGVEPFRDFMDQNSFQAEYGIQQYPQEALPTTESVPIIAIRIAQILLMTLIFIIGIISFIKIRKISDKTMKRKKIRNTIIIIAMLVLILIASFVIPARLLTR